MEVERVRAGSTGVVVLVPRGREERGTGSRSRSSFRRFVDERWRSCVRTVTDSCTRGAENEPRRARTRGFGASGDAVTSPVSAV